MLTSEHRHLVNSAPFFLSINAQSWIPVETKARLLEWKIRADLMQYAARAVPSLSLDGIKSYQPERPGRASIFGELFACFLPSSLFSFPLSWASKDAQSKRDSLISVNAPPKL